MLWIALAILPDTVSILVSEAKMEKAIHPAFEFSQKGLAVECHIQEPATELLNCVTSHSGTLIGPTWFFLPVEWADIESTQGEYDWAPLELVLNEIEKQGWEPVLSLQTVPLWLASRGHLWDRDSHAVVSSFPAELAFFVKRVAERYGTRVRFYQLGEFANGPVPNFPYGVNPVRYAQMVRSVAPAILNTVPDAVLLTAPLLPVTADGSIAFTPEIWLRRLSDTGVTKEFPLVQLWKPDVVIGGDSPHIERHGSFLPWHSTLGSRRWLLSTTSGPEIWRISTFFRPGKAVQNKNCLTRIGNCVARDWGWEFSLSFLLLSLLIVLGWVRSISPLAGAIRTARSRLPPRMLELIWWLLTLSLLTSIYFVPSWVWAVGPFMLLSGMALLRPVSLWTLALATLPLHQVHANFMSPLLGQSFSLAPAQILAIALTPAILGKLSFNSMSRARGFQAWVLGGWFLLLILGGLGADSSGHISQWIRIGFFPGWLALLSVGIGLNRESVKAGLTSMTLGVSLFGLLALTQWGLGQNASEGGLLRLTGLTFSPNHAAMVLERGLWLLLPFAWMSHARWKRMCWFGFVALTGTALLLTLSRGALFLGLPGGMVVFWLLRRDVPSVRSTGHFYWPLLAAVVIIATFGIVLIGFRSELWERILDALPVAARQQIWLHTWDIAKMHPWFGLGVDGLYRQAPASFPYSSIVSPDISHAHNVWLETFSRWGAMGIVWLVGLGIGLVRSLPSWNADPQHSLFRAGIAASLIAGFAHAQVDAFWHWPDIATFNLLLILCLVALPVNYAASAHGNQQTANKNAGGS